MAPVLCCRPRLRSLMADFSPFDIFSTTQNPKITACYQIRETFQIARFFMQHFLLRTCKLQHLSPASSDKVLKNRCVCSFTLIKIYCQIQLTHSEESAHRELQDSEMITHRLDKHKYCYCIVFGRGWTITERIIDLET